MELSEVVLTKEACDELAFWGENVDSLNFHCPWVPLQPPAKFVYSEASDLACSSSLSMSTRFFIRIGVLQKAPKAPRGGNLGL